MMKLFILSTATYSEDGELSTSAIVYTDLDKAKASLKEDYDTSNAQQAEDGYEEGWISADGMKWGTNRDTVHQVQAEIITHDLLHVQKLF